MYSGDMKLTFAFLASISMLVVTALAQPPLQADRAQQSACGRNIRRLAIGAMMFAGDHNFVLKVGSTQASVRKAIRKSLPSEAYWNCPTGGKDAYSFNLKIAGKSLDKLKDPTAVVMFYEGHYGKLDFRHDGKAWVAFCDGHVRAYDMVHAKTLQWKAK